MRLTLFGKGLILISIPVLFEVVYLGVAITLQWSTAPTRQEVVKYLQAAEGFNKEHLRTLRQTQVWLAWLFLARCLAGFGTAGLLVFLFRRAVSDRFAVLVGNTRRLAQGQELAP